MLQIDKLFCRTSVGWTKLGAACCAELSCPGTVLVRSVICGRLCMLVYVDGDGLSVKLGKFN